MRCPIIFLTARVTDADKIAGFAAGGDDYVTKPFSLDELSARVAAHLRREERPENQARVWFGGDVAVDYLEKAVYVRGERVPLAKKEYEIVELLSQNRGQVFDKERIYERVLGLGWRGLQQRRRRAHQAHPRKAYAGRRAGADRNRLGSGLQMGKVKVRKRRLRRLSLKWSFFLYAAVAVLAALAAIMLLTAICSELQSDLYYRWETRYGEQYRIPAQLVVDGEVVGEQMAYSDLAV